MQYLEERAENPRVYKLKKSKLAIRRARSQKDILNLEQAFDSQDSISTSLAAPRRKPRKKFVPKKRSR